MDSHRPLVKKKLICTHKYGHSHQKKRNKHRQSRIQNSYLSTKIHYYCEIHIICIQAHKYTDGWANLPVCLLSGCLPDVCAKDRCTQCLYSAIDFWAFARMHVFALSHLDEVLEFNKRTQLLVGWDVGEKRTVRGELKEDRGGVRWHGRDINTFKRES